MAGDDTGLTLKACRRLTSGEVVAVARAGRPVALDPGTAQMLDARRAEIVAHVAATQAPAYGFNRGFGHNVKLAVSPEDAALLQRNLILSHAAGMGEHAGDDVVRATMLLRAQSLAQGHSGVRSLVVRTLIDCLNAGVTPFVPKLGSVSASGDLAPLSHIALTLIGEGDAFHKGARMKARDALGKAGIAPLVLDMKEGLALNNGVQFATAIGILAEDALRLALKTHCVTAACAAQVMLGTDAAFRADLHALRPHRGSQAVARAIFALMAESPIREAHRGFDTDHEIQDPYNLRCAAQILGAPHELLARARATFETEANSVTDNPILLPLTDGAKAGQHIDIVSGGHFHGMPIAIDAYGLIQAASIMAQLTNTRAMRYVDGARNKGLGADLKWPGPTDDPARRAKQAVSSALMIPEYASAGIANWIWGLAMPSHLFSIPTDAGQEDHVSMASNAAFRALDAAARVFDALAIEFVFLSQAAAIRMESGVIPRADGGTPLTLAPSQRRLSATCDAVITAARVHFPIVTEDRYMADELAALARWVRSGEAATLAEASGAFSGF